MPEAGMMAGSGRASTWVPLKWLASWIRERGARISMSLPAQAASEPQAAGRRADQPMPALIGRHGGGERSRHGGDRTVERQLPQHREAAQGIRRNGPDGAHDRKGNGQIVMASLLRQVGRGEVDRDALGRKGEAGGDQGRADPLAGFRHRLVRQADDGERDCTGRDLNLDIDRPRLDSLERNSGNARHHPASTSRNGAMLARPVETR
jgi:hypothetical protein